MLTARGRTVIILLVIIAAFVAGLTAHLWNPYAAVLPGVEMTKYEDGSGVLEVGGHRIRTYPEDTFPWDCATMGNRICGDIDDAHVG